MPERIAHIIWNMGIGGAERALFQLVRQQRRHGYEADVIVGRGGGYYAELTEGAGATVHDLQQRRGLDFSVSDRFRRIIRDYDIVHFHSAEIGLMHMATRQAGPRLYYTHRAGVFEYPFQQRMRYRAAGRYLRSSFEAISGNTDQAGVAAEQLFGISRHDVLTTYNGIDFSLLDPERPRHEVMEELGLSGREIVFGTSAHLRDFKRVDLLLDAVAGCGDERVHGLILGDGPARRDLEAKAAALGIADRCRFVGMQEKIGEYLQVVDIFSLPSGPQESFGNAVVEAMGVGIPSIVMADGGGMVEHLEDEVSGFIARDGGHLARIVARLAGDAGLRESIGSAARDRVHSRYALEGLVGRYERLYALRRRAGSRHTVTHTV